MKSDIEELRKNYMDNPPEGMTSIARPENNAKKAVLQSANCKEQI